MKPRAITSRLAEIPGYSPPAHSGTVNRKIVDAAFGAGYEMVHGEVMPGGDAHAHYHKRTYQVVYVLEGTLEHTVDDEPPERCEPGTVIRIPPLVVHRGVGVGDRPAKVLVIYSPPLDPADVFFPDRHNAD